MRRLSGQDGQEKNPDMLALRGIERASSLGSGMGHRYDARSTILSQEEKRNIRGTMSGSCEPPRRDPPWRAGKLDN
jgi:hypothetical protein